MKSIHRTANLCKFRTEWHQYIPTEPLSTYYRPVVERPFERVWEPRGVETPIVESVENWPMSRSSGWRDALGMGEVIEVRSQVAEEAPLEFPDERKILQQAQRACKKHILNEVNQDCEQFDLASLDLDKELELEMSQTLEAQISLSNTQNYHSLISNLRADSYVQSLSALEAELQDWTERACARESFDTTTWNDQECHFQAYKQELEAFFAELRQSERHCQKVQVLPSALLRANNTQSMGGGRGHCSLSAHSGGNNGGAGDDSNWNNGGGGDPRWNYFGFIVFGGAIVIIGKIIVDYGYKIIQNNLEKLLSSTKKQIDDIKTKNTLHRSLPSLLPVLASGPALVVLSYLFHPQRLRQLVELLTEMGNILAQQIGRLLLMALPPQLQEAARFIGHFIQVVGAQLGRFVDQVVLPVALYGRALGILMVKVYFLLKLASLGLEVYKVCGKAVVAQAHQIAEALSGTGEASIVLFVENFVKSVSLLVVGLIPIPKDLPKFIRILGRMCIVSFVVSADGRFFVQKVANGLLAYPLVVSLCGCIAGRWAMILLTVNIARWDTTLRKYSLPFGVLLYVFRVYELAMTATPNFLPN